MSYDSTETVIDLTFRPLTYWPQSPTQGQLLSRIKGHVRREEARRILQQFGFPGLTAFLVRESLNEDERTAWASIHPDFLGGEYLPDLDGGAVEIARISLRSSTADQISIRALPVADGIRYSIVDEYDSAFEPTHLDAPDTLPLAALIAFIDGSTVVGDPFPGGVFWSGILHQDSWGEAIEDSASFSSIDSAFYPQLADYYAQAVDKWVAARYLEGAHEEGREEDEAV